MSVVAAFRSAVPDVRGRSRLVRAALARVVDRLATSPLDNSVLGAIGVPRAPQRPGPVRQGTDRQALSDDRQCSRRQPSAHVRT